ncbi:MAG: hypothetical protein RR877_09510, partial [Aurantimicrobium sp.]
TLSVTDPGEIPTPAQMRVDYSAEVERYRQQLNNAAYVQTASQARRVPTTPTTGSNLDSLIARTAHSTIYPDTNS